MSSKRLFNPISLPIFFFMGAIAIGAVLLHSSFSTHSHTISWLDALFTATSAVCVTGLNVVDTGSKFSQLGQVIIMVLIQLGGLGIMTFSTLAFYLLKKKISLTDQMAVGQGLLHDPKFHLGRFLIQVVSVVFLIEFIGAILLFMVDPEGFQPFSALFHSVSAFCNAGFSLNANSLMMYKDNWSVNFIIMALIVLGGVGFSVIIEGASLLWSNVRRNDTKPRRCSKNLALVLKTTIFLIVTGWLCLFLSEFIGFREYRPLNEAVLSSLFQSVTCRTAGFNTIEIAKMTNASLVFMIFLMYIGGAPGSCAGGIKVTTLRVLWAFVKAQINGNEQVVIGKYAVDKESISDALSLLFFSLALLFACVLILQFTEGGDIPHVQARGKFLECLFEAVSAFGTVGLSVGLTPKLSPIGKMLIIFLMFVGRVGPLALVASIQSFRTKLYYSLPEEKITIG